MESPHTSLEPGERVIFHSLPWEVADLPSAALFGHGCIRQDQ